MFSNPIVEEASPSAIDVFDGEEIKNDAILGEEQALSRSIRQDSLNIAGIDRDNADYDLFNFDDDEQDNDEEIADSRGRMISY